MSETFQPSQNPLFLQLYSSIKTLQNLREKKEEDKETDQIIASVAHQKNKEIYEHQLRRLRDELSTKGNELSQLQKVLSNYQNENSLNYRKQLRRLTEHLAQKSQQIRILDRDIARKNSRISYLQKDILALKSEKQNLETSISKSLQKLKSDFNQIDSLNHEKQVNIFVFEAKYKQANDKLQMVLKTQVQLQKKYQLSQQKIKKLKRQNTQLQQDLLHMKLENERLKQRQKQSGRGHFNSQNYNLSSLEDKSDALFSQLEDLYLSFKKDINVLKNIEIKVNDMAEQQMNESSFFSEILSLQSENQSLRQEIHKIKAEINPLHKEQILLDNHPRLYQFFKQKMREIQQFEVRIKTIQQNLLKIMESIQKIAIEGIPVEGAAQPLDQGQLRQQWAQSKLAKQLEQKLMNSAQKARKQQQKYFQQKISFLQGQNDNLQEQNKKLQGLIRQQRNEQNVQNTQNNQRLLNQFRNSLFSDSTETQINQTILSQKDDQIRRDQQLLTYLQLKSAKLQEKLEIATGKIVRYKQQFRKLLVNQNTNNFKDFKIKRCFECYLKIQQTSPDSGKLCQSCQRMFHVHQCFDSHGNSCKSVAKKKTKRQVSGSKYNDPDLNRGMDYFQ